VRVCVLLLPYDALRGEDPDPLECGDREDVDVVKAGGVCAEAAAAVDISENCRQLAD